MKRLLIVSLLFFSLFSSVAALEIRRGQIRIVLEEDKGTFSLYHSARGEEEKSFFVSEDPRTTGIFLLIDNKIYRMGQNTFFQQQAFLTDTGAAYSWASPVLKVVLEFVFISSTGSSYSDGVQMKLTIENVSTRTQNIGARVLFDTWLGEAGKEHFQLSDGRNIDKETELSGNFPDYWVSGAPSSSTRVQVMLKGKGTTIPGKVIFANWKRLNESTWQYDTRVNRNFNYLPYSINDSAVAQYYEILPLDGSRKREISILMGLFHEQGFSEIAPAVAAVASEPVVPVDPENQKNIIEALRVDLTQVNKVLQQIEAALSSGTELDEQTMNNLRNSVSELEERRSRYLTK